MEWLDQTNDRFILRHKLGWVSPTLLMIAANSAFGQEGQVAENSAVKYLVHGRPLDEQIDKLGNGTTKRYMDAFQEFPEVSDCVSDDIQGPKYLNAKMYWGEMQTFEQVNWCVFQVVSELKDPHKTQNWFAINGFNGALIEYSKTAMRFSNHNGKGFVFSAGIPIEENPIPISWTRRLGAYGLSIGMMMTFEGRPLNVQTILNRN